MTQLVITLKDQSCLPNILPSMILAKKMLKGLVVWREIHIFAA